MTAVLVAVWLLLTFAMQLSNFVGPEGWIDTPALKDVADLKENLQIPKDQPPFVPSWSLLYLCGTNSTALTALFWAAVVVVVLFAIGVLPRITGVLTWIAVASFTANPAFQYEGDALLLLLTFYLMVAYVLFGQRTPGISWAGHIFGPLAIWPLSRSEPTPAGMPRPSLAANVALRLVQVHIALIVFSSGLHKLQFGDWWAGTALWFPLHPPFKTTLADAIAERPNAESYLGLLNVGTYCVLAWQIGFPLFAWRPRWRFVVIGGGVIGWIGAALLWGVPLIGPAIFIGCLSFVTPTTWRRILNRLPLKSTSAVTTNRRSDESASLAVAGER
jgi:hypothetical protein